MFKNTEIFENASVPKAVAVLSIPTILSMLVNVIYNMVDTFFIARTGNPNQIAAVSLAIPVFLFCMAAGNIFGIGGSAFLSRSLGEKKYDRVKHISSFCFYMCIAIGIVLCLIFISFMPVILKLCGASINTAPFAKDYLSWIALGAPFVTVSVAFGSIVRAEGSSKTAMTGQMIGMIINIILDPIMILGLKMNVAGAAIATVIGNICSCVFYCWYILFSGRSVLSLKIKDFMCRDGILTNTFAIGIPASINNILMSVSNIIMNNCLASYGDYPVAAMGIAMKANMLVVFIQMGLAMGIQPLIGYNYGSRNYKRMKSVMKFSLVCNLIIGSVLTLVYFCFTKQIVSIFINNQEIINYGVPMVRALMLSMPFIGIMFIFSFTFQALGKAIPSLILSISRQGFVFLPMIFIGKAIAGLNGVVYAQPIADIISMLLALAIFLYLNKSFNAVPVANNSNPKDYMNKQIDVEADDARSKSTVNNSELY